MASRIVTFANAVVTALAAEMGNTATVSREWDTPVEPANLHLLTDRKVWVFPLGYTSPVLTRTEDLGEYKVAVIVAERYEEQGLPPNSWVDGLVEFTEGKVWDILGDPRRAEILSGYYADQGELTVYDPELLRSKKLFWSESTFAFRVPE